MKKRWKILLIIGIVIAFLILVLIFLFVLTAISRMQENQRIISEKLNETKGGIEFYEKSYIDMPYKNVEFKVKVPSNTPSDYNVYLLIRSFADSTKERIMMNKTSEGYKALVKLPEKALVRYFYEAAKEGMMWGENREKFSENIDIAFRYLYVEPEIKEIGDIVARWYNLDYTIERGIVKGKVTSKDRGIEAIVSVAGFHVITDYYGDFEIEVPIGKQNILVSTVLGDYKYKQEVVVVEANKVVEKDFELESAKKFTINFNLDAGNIPEWAVPRIAGSVYQLGSTRLQKNNFEFKVPDRHIFMKKNGNTYTASIDLYEGTYIEYAYYLGTDEKTLHKGEGVFRGFVVNGSIVRNDKANWKEENIDVEIIFQVEVPPNTPKTYRIFIDGWGGMLALDKISEDKHGLVMYLSEGREQDYIYSHGISYIGLQGWEKVEPETLMNRKLDVYKNKTINNTIVINDKVEKWRLYPEAKKVEKNKERKVKFIVAVPSTNKVYLKGNTIELQNVEMKKLSDILYEAEIIFDSEKEIEYYYSTSTLESEKKRINAEYDGQIVIDAVNSQFSYPKIVGIQLNDYWTPNFLALLDSTLSHLQSRNIKWIDFPVIWYHTPINNEIKLSPIAPEDYIGGIYPTQDILALSKEIKSRGMKLMIDGFVVNRRNPISSAEKQLEENENYALYLLDIAKNTDADLLVLPSLNGYFNQSEYTLINEKMKELIKKIKQDYNGKIAINGFYPASYEFENYDYQKEADYVIYNFFEELNVIDKKEEIFYNDNGEEVCCIYSSSASVSQLKEAIEKVLNERYKKIYEKYGKPILFNQIGFASLDGSSFRPNDGFLVDSFYPDRKGFNLDLTEQANLYEAFFQAIEDENWIAGGFSFGYTYTDFPLSKSYDIRSKPAEATLSKYAYAAGRS